MANGMIAQQVNRQTVAAALAAARTEAAEHRAWINAINKAALELEASSSAFDGDTLRIASRTIKGTRYTVNALGFCECKAAKESRPCWHRAAWRLLRKAAEMVAPVRVMPSEAELQALVDELFA